MSESDPKRTLADLRGAERSRALGPYNRHTDKDKSMGEARRRGNREQREAVAIQRNKREFAKAMGMADDDDPTRQALKAGLKPFLDRMTPEHWQRRRAAVLSHLRERLNGSKLSEAQSIRVQIGRNWLVSLFMRPSD